MKQLAPSPRLQGSSNTPSPSVFTIATRLPQALSKPISQACLKLRAAPTGSRGIPLPSLSSVPRAKQPRAELCWHCTSRVRAKTAMAGLRLPRVAGFRPEGGVAARVFSSEKTRDSHDSEKPYPDSHESEIRLLRSPAGKRLQCPEFPLDNPTYARASQA